MDLATMRTIIRRDLKDEDAENYRWSNDKLDRHIAHALKDLSEALPLPAKATLPTSADSRVIDISALTGRVTVEAVEYPLEQYPPSYQKFALWGHALTLLGDEAPNGDNCNVYYGILHTLDDEGSTIDTKHEEMVAMGAEGYAALEWAGYAVNRVNLGGNTAPKDFLDWGNQRLRQFRQELKRLGRRNRVRIRQLYRV